MSRADENETLTLYVGTYTTDGQGGEGIHVLRLDTASVALALTGIVEPAINPSFLALHPSGRYLYAANETGDHGGERTGSVSAYAIRDPGGLTLLDRQASGGADPCYLTVHESGRCLLVANYSGGTVALLPVREDGRLEPASAIAQHEGSGPNPERQDAPHPHAVVVGPAGRLAYVADLGLDRVLAYECDATAGTLAPREDLAAPLAPGSGPRHLALHPGGRFAYVVNELDSTVTVLARARGGALEPVQTVSVLPGGWMGENTSAGLHVHPSGGFVYASNRGHDSIAVLAAGADGGRLELVTHEPTRGRHPRGFALDRAGRFLVVANQKSGSLTSFRIESATGRLEWTGQEVEVPSPVLVLFGPPGKS